MALDIVYPGQRPDPGAIGFFESSTKIPGYSSTKSGWVYNASSVLEMFGSELIWSKLVYGCSPKNFRNSFNEDTFHFLACSIPSISTVFRISGTFLAPNAPI